MALAEQDWVGRNKELLSERSLHNETHNPFHKQSPDTAFMETSQATLKFTDQDNKIQKVILQNGKLFFHAQAGHCSKFDVDEQHTSKKGQVFLLKGLPGGEGMKLTEEKCGLKTYLKTMEGEYIDLDVKNGRVIKSSCPSLEVDFHERQVFAYSGQKLNSVDQQMADIRSKHQARGEKDWLLTYSEDKNSGCFPLLDYEVDLAGILRAPDRNWKDSRELFRYPKARDSADRRKHERDVSPSRRQELKEPWDEGELSAKLALRAGVVHNAFDAKSLGTGGAHVIPLRQEGLRKEEGKLAPPPTRWEQETTMKTQRIQEERMRFPKQNNMGTMNTVDKYHAGMLEDAPKCKGFMFKSRHVPIDIARRYGEAMQHNPDNCEAAPISLQISEDFFEDKRTSLHPDRMSMMCARDLVFKAPLSAREIRSRDKEKPPHGTLACWQKTCLSGKAKNFRKTAFAPAQVPHSAR
jgi:hypothetical protein